MLVGAPSNCVVSQVRLSGSQLRELFAYSKHDAELGAHPTRKPARARRSVHLDEVDDPRRHLVEGGHDHKLACVDLLLEVRHIEHLLHLRLGVANHALAVARARVGDVVDRLYARLEPVLRVQQHVAQVRRLLADLLHRHLGGRAHRPAASVAHHHHQLDAQVLDGVVHRAALVLAVRVARVARDEEIARALVEDDFHRRARVSAAEHRHLGHLPFDERAAHCRRHLGVLGKARPEAHVTRLEVGEQLGRRLRFDVLVALFMQLRRLLHRRHHRREHERPFRRLLAGGIAEGDGRAHLDDAEHVRRHVGREPLHVD
mmetsp:Transcript_7723/g.19695  ORF Transcript_7723/g.19695 Transcript_7723/m.19695 type:complete len:316 (-) Transcript_7723:317-1264(-)